MPRQRLSEFEQITFAAAAGLISVFVLGGIWSSHPSNNTIDTILGAILLPGAKFGALFAKRIPSRYLAPLAVAAGEMLFLSLIFYVGIGIYLQINESRRRQQPDPPANAP